MCCVPGSVYLSHSCVPKAFPFLGRGAEVGVRGHHSILQVRLCDGPGHRAWQEVRKASGPPTAEVIGGLQLPQVPWSCLICRPPDSDQGRGA